MVSCSLDDKFVASEAHNYDHRGAIVMQRRKKRDPDGACGMTTVVWWAEDRRQEGSSGGRKWIIKRYFGYQGRPQWTWMGS